MERGASTEIIHHHRHEEGVVAPLTAPIYDTTTFVFDSAAEVQRYQEGRSSKFLYSRYANPTVMEVEGTIAALERTEAALLFASGMAATTTALISLVQAGDEVVCSSAIYGGTLHLIKGVLSKFGVGSRFLSLPELAAVDRAIGPRTRVVWFESPINPTLRCVDLEAVGAACRARGVLSIIDNTFASPINQTPIPLGIDLCMHSATKYLNGHSDVTAGALAGPRHLLHRILETRKQLGTILDPRAAHAIGRGLKTLALRIERHNQTAMAVARFLESDPRVERTYYPGLESHPDHVIARKQMRGFGGIVCIDVGGGLEGASRFFDRLQVIQRAASLGGPESLCSLPVLTSQFGHSDEELERAGVTQSMARLSVGLEDAPDLVADLDQALG
jgi:cystathionine beta-lyase/cystathionine gamma-synthase